MAVALVKVKKEWFGLSTDVKPITIIVGARFIETDTGKVWTWSGSEWWADLIEVD